MKKSPRDILKKIKDKEASEEKANFTFRLEIGLMDKFRSKCQKNDVSMASVLEEMLRDFVGSD